ncbi:hypothetical protein K2Z84_27030 [Candidatus Binatia bacterium]|jgi:hypothetical protein|nr:hypothetical protein [Candidatus Binatia bacterium]
MTRRAHLTVGLTLLLASSAAPLAPARAGSAAQPRRVVIEPRTSSRLVATVGKPLQLSAHLELDDGRLLRIDDQVTWTSANPGILRVAGVSDPAPSGSVTPLRPGVAAVAITYPRIADAVATGVVSRMLGDAVTIVVVEP